MVKKTFILSIHSLLSSADSMLHFGSDNEIVIPLPVITGMRKAVNNVVEKRKISTAILDYIESFPMDKLMREQGVLQKNGSTLRIIDSYKDEDLGIDLSDFSYTDKRCLQIAKGLGRKNQRPTIFITRNPGLRIAARSIGIKAQNFKDLIFPSLSDQYTGRIECNASTQTIDTLFSKGSIRVKDIQSYTKYHWYTHMFLNITSLDGKTSALARYDGKKIVPLRFQNATPSKVVPLNAGQTMLQEALMTPPNIAPLVIAKGNAGTGKTYGALAVALEQTGKQNVYTQILVTAPVTEIGEGIGFLPGDIDSKISPHIGGIIDNAREIMKNKSSKKEVLTSEQTLRNGNIKIEAIGMLRGRTLPKTFFIIDETQNIDPDDIKSIVTRSAEGSKFVFLGDPTQIDNPNLNERYNGLVYLSEKMKDYPGAWQIGLTDKESVRSDLARYAAQIL